MLEKLKEHPAIAVVGGILLFVLVYVFSRGGSSSAAPVAVRTGPSDAVLQSQIVAGAQGQQLQASLLSHANDVQAQYDATVLAAQVRTNSDTLAAGVANAQTAGAVAISNNQTAGAVDIAGISAAAQTAITNAQVNGQVLIAKNANDTAAIINGQNQDTQRVSINAQTSMFHDQLATESHIADTNATLQTNLTRTAADVILGESSNAKDVSLANIFAGRDVTLAGIDSQNQKFALEAGVLNNQTAAGVVTAGKVIDATVTLTQGDQANQGKAIDAYATLTADQLAHQAALANGVLTLVGQGKYNIGGEGGANTTAVTQTALNPNVAYNPYQNSPGQTSPQWANILNGAANLAKGIGTGFFG